MKVVIWWNIPCKAISGVIKDLSKIRSVELIAVTGELTSARKNMGWEENTFAPAKHIFIKDNDWDIQGEKILSDYSDYLHIFNGFYYPKRIYNLILKSIQKDIEFGIFSEAPSNPYKGLKKISVDFYHHFLLPFKTKAVAKNAKFIFCLSGSSNSEIKKLKILGWDSKKIIPFGYFSEDSYNRKERIANLIPNIFCSGNLVPHKGVDILIKALKIIDNRNINFQCHITGNGSEKVKLENLCDKFGLKDRIIFHGVLSQNHYNKLEREMDILVAPGRIEPWGIRINEAIQNGIAVVISDQIGAKELIIASNGGKIFKSRNFNDLANKLIPYLKNNTYLQKTQQMNLNYKDKINPKQVSSYIFEVLKSIENSKDYPKPNWL